MVPRVSCEELSSQGLQICSRNEAFWGPDEGSEEVQAKGLGDFSKWGVLGV